MCYVDRLALDMYDESALIPKSSGAVVVLHCYNKWHFVDLISISRKDTRTIPYLSTSQTVVLLLWPHVNDLCWGSSRIYRLNPCRPEKKIDTFLQQSLPAPYLAHCPS